MFKLVNIIFIILILSCLIIMVIKLGMTMHVNMKCKQATLVTNIPHPTYLPTSKICRVELCTELYYAIIPTLFLCFLLICYPYILLYF